MEAELEQTKQYYQKRIREIEDKYKYNGAGAKKDDKKEKKDKKEDKGDKKDKKDKKDDKKQEVME